MHSLQRVSSWMTSIGRQSFKVPSVTGKPRSPYTPPSNYHGFQLWMARPLSSGRLSELPIIQRHSRDFPDIRPLQSGDMIAIGNRGTAARRFVESADVLGHPTLGLLAEGDVPVDTITKTTRLSESGVSAYLNIPKIIATLKENNVRFIWPGWGLWSENTDAHTAFRRNGIYVLGPEPSVVAALGDKTTARTIAIKAGAPVVPGTDVLPTLDDAIRAAEGIGFPVMIKAVSGGGGKGMRIVRSAGDLAAEYESASKEALSSFNDARVFMEKLVEGHIRHVEVQLVGDLHGNVRHFSTRECSVQRRNQKVIERCLSRWGGRIFLVPAVCSP